MYRCFKLSLDLCEFLQNDKQYIEKCKKYGDELKKGLINDFDSILKKAVDENGVISGEDFINTWFPTGVYDVFLSYSHDDEEIALLFAGFLNYQFGLKVFIDELFWGSADQLLRELDNKYCKDNDYNKRNFTTTHVHAMLSTAIARTINNSEVIIFINSEKSIYKVSDEIDKDRTLSPWIYEEIFFTSVIGKREWFEHRTEMLNEGQTYFQKSMQISYLLPDEHLIPMEYEDLCSWSKLWDERNEKSKGRYGIYGLPSHEKILHPLNVLYTLKSINSRRG